MNLTAVEQSSAHRLAAYSAIRLQARPAIRALHGRQSVGRQGVSRSTDWRRLLLRCANAQWSPPECRLRLRAKEDAETSPPARPRKQSTDRPNSARLDRAPSIK